MGEDSRNDAAEPVPADGGRKPRASLRRRGALIIAVLLVAVVVGSWRGGLWNSPFTGERAAQTESGAGASTGLTLFPVGDRPQVPDLRGSTLDGDQLALSDVRGHVVVLNVWGSWCAPCRAEAPDLARVARETAPKGVRFVGIDTRDNPASARAFVRSFKIPYPSLIDTDGKLLLAFTGVIPVSAVPSTLVVDTRGNITARVVGKVTYETLRGLVDDVLAETPPTSTQKGGS